ncbi:hypothetical protein [Gracilimonas mengyeensis]|uniref:Uncharacterized protein n=1 Tax=Gracilimonas mengyeensis TaxID=1302730 RepID=A0A521BVC5_9BACT|nr:hypothetical protein [Gracilimonas mengyeensis]SMO51045.1 hypothetical protein SAMN06265219_103121 [Gracilimonas mengyeensis]
MAVTGCRNSKAIIEAQSSWQSSKVDLSGQYNREPDSLYYSDKQELFYSISNDSNYLYVTIEFNSAAIGQKMLVAGSTLWVDLEGKQMKSLGIQYPLAKNMERRTGAGHSKEGLEDLVEEKTFLKLINFPKIPENEEYYHLADGIVNARVWENPTTRNLIYAAIIPFEQLAAQPFKEEAADEPITIGLETGAFRRPSGPGDGRTPPGGPPGGFPGGGNKQMPPPQDRRQENGLDKATEVWFQFTLKQGEAE